MKEKTRQYLLIVIVGVCLYAALMNFPIVLHFVGTIIGMILPIIAGGILALFLSVPMNGVERRLRRFFRKRKKSVSSKLITVLSFVITILCILLVFVLVLTLLIPEIVRSGKSLYAQIEENIPHWAEYLNREDAGSDWINIGWLQEMVSEINWQQVVRSISNGANGLLTNVADAVSSTVSLVITAVFAMIISVYLSLGKETVSRHVRKLVQAYLKPLWAKRVFHFCGLFRRSFTKFLTGQCSEAVILGTLMFFAFTIFQLPYGLLVGALTAVCAIIPYIGAFISCSVSVILVLLIDPFLALRCLVVYLVVQFIENQFIYPRVVGSSVGLPPFYTLIAAMIGGKLFGIIGIIFFIPLAAVGIELVKEDAGRRLRAKGQKDS